MLKNQEVLYYIAQTVGKPVMAVYNELENTYYYYLVDSFKPINPSNAIFYNELKGKRLEGLLAHIGGFAHGLSVDEKTVLTALDSVELYTIQFAGNNWIKFS